MRNWNDFLHRVVADGKPRFEPTYEELKLRRASLGVRMPFSVLSLPMRNWNFLSSLLRRLFLYVLSLPMRNWNCCRLCPATERISRFWAYLWGIETVRFLSTFLKPGRFWAYLWGIETGIIDLAVARPHVVLSLPMRNWNQEQLTLDFDPFTLFWAYLWGIETIIGRGSDN